MLGLSTDGLCNHVAGTVLRCRSRAWCVIPVKALNIHHIKELQCLTLIS